MSIPIGTWSSVHALRSPDHPALIDGDTGRTSTFRELDERVVRLASALRGRGVREGDRVAVFSINSPEMLELFLAVAKLGAITVMVNFRFTAPEVRYILEDSGAVLLLASSPLEGTARAAAEGTEVRDIIGLATAAQRSAGEHVGFDALLEEGSTDIDLPDVDPDSTATLMYTSGTTGAPKGAILTHANLFWDAIYHNAVENGLNRFDVNLVTAPLFHVGALAVYTLPSLYWGASNVVLESFAPSTWAAAVQQHRVTKAFAVPTMWSAILGSGELKKHDVSSLDVAISGGAPCPIPVIEGLRAKGVKFTEGFGMTETAAAASTLPSEYVTSHAGSVGRPSLHVDFRVVDPAGEDVPQGEVGELIIRGPSVSPGYWNRPDANAESHRDGWFYSGDLARVDADGFYYLVDRKKDMVISGGENVFPIEIEQVLYGHPAIAEVSVIGTPDDKWGETVTAVIVPKEGAGTDETALADDITAYARERLAGFKVPRRFHFAEELPRTATGKVRKVELRHTYTADAQHESTDEPTEEHEATHE